MTQSEQIKFHTALNCIYHHIPTTFVLSYLLSEVIVQSDIVFNPVV